MPLTNVTRGNHYRCYRGPKYAPETSVGDYNMLKNEQKLQLEDNLKNKKTSKIFWWPIFLWAGQFSEGEGNFLVGGGGFFLRGIFLDTPKKHNEDIF